MNKQISDFIERHKGIPTQTLRLKYGSSDPDINAAITHLECVAKAGNKFETADGALSLQPSFFASALSVEQASSAILARFHASLLPPSAKVLDMTCGLGIDSKAFLASGCKSLTAIEINRELADAAKINLGEFDNARVVCGDSTEWLAGCAETFDTIFIDPARRGSDGGRVYDIGHCSPDVLALMPELLRHASKIIIKLSPMLDVSETLRRLPQTSRLIVAGSGGECREIVVVIDVDNPGREALIEIVEDGVEAMAFTMGEEQKAAMRIKSPEAGLFICEPSASAMKAGAFRLMSRAPMLGAVAPNSHLYIAENPRVGFPGKFYEITQVMEFSSSVVRQLARQKIEASIAVRNFPLRAEELRSRLRARESSRRRIYATTEADGRRVLVFTSRP